jgi:PIN domain nuclease of toxin-antitoxin system
MLLLDTNAWLSWTSWPARLTPKATRAITEEEANRGVMVSAISVWEVALKVATGKLQLDRDVRQWIDFASSYPGCTMLPLEPIDALESTLLPGDFHKDPADRILVALARRLDCPIVTSDKAIRAYRHVHAIW